MAIVWERRGEAYHAMVTGPLDEVRFYMTVATLPNGRWEWLVWDPRNDSFVSDDDVLTVQEAMRDAELFAAWEFRRSLLSRCLLSPTGAERR